MSRAMTYLIQGEYGGPIKIGFTRSSLRGRLSSIQTGNPERLRVVLRIPGDRERELHQAFAEYRLGGEWFDVSVEQVEAYFEPEASAAEHEEVRRLALASLEQARSLV